jgi:single-strand DNA-binding protein
MSLQSRTSNDAVAVAECASSDHLVLIEGVLSSEPARRELPSGTVLTMLEITSRGGGRRRLSTPVSVEGEQFVELAKGDAVVILGVVRRRFFRAAGATASRTEVVAEVIVRASDRRGRGRIMRRCEGLLADFGAAKP